MPRLALIRHGHTIWNRSGRIQGRQDIPLDTEARKELAQYTLPADWQTATLVSSPLKRAHETAQLIAKRSPQCVEALIEMDWGDWEGRCGQDLRADPQSGFCDISDWGWDYTPPNGETPAEVWHRLRPWVAHIKTNIVVVCHIGVMRVILAKAYGWQFCGPCPFQIKRNRLYVIELSDGQPVSHAQTVHLEKQSS